MADQEDQLAVCWGRDSFRAKFFDFKKAYSTDVASLKNTLTLRTLSVDANVVKGSWYVIWLFQLI